MPSSRDVSISNHVGRRRRSVSNGLNNYCSGSNSGSSGSAGSSGCSSSSSSNKVRHHYPQHHNNLPQQHSNNNMQPPPPRSRNYEGGYDSHAASYGNYDAPSPHCRRPGSDGEHGQYTMTEYIRSSTPPSNDNRSNVVILPRTGERLRRNSDPDEEIYQTHHPTNAQSSYNNDDYRYNNSRQRRPPSRTPGGKYYSQNHDPMLRVSQASTIPAKGSGGYRSAPQPHDIEDNQSSWDEEQSSMMQSTAMNDNSCLSEFSSYCPSVKTASTAGSSTTMSSGSSTLLIEEDVIRQGVIDISMLIATYLAGALSFVIGILLTLCSPVIKMIKLIVGDARGILGDAGFIHELGSLWRVYRDLRTRSSGSSGSSNRDAHSTTSSSSYNPRYDQYSRNANYYDDESTVGGGDDQSSVYTENSPQYMNIGGWRPRVNSSSVGSSQLGTGMGSAASNSSNHTGNSSSRRSSSRSYPSLSQVHEGQSSSYYQDDKRSSPQAQQQQAPMSHGAPSMMYQDQASQHHPTTPLRSQGPPSGYYSNGGYQPARARSYSASPVKQSQQRHCGPSSAVGVSSHYSPQKNRRQRPGVV